MSKGGRPKDLVWSSFVEIQNDSQKSKRVKCRSCGSEMSALIARMKNHLEKKCPKNKNGNEEQDDDIEVVELDLEMTDSSELNTNRSHSTTPQGPSVAPVEQNQDNSNNSSGNKEKQEKLHCVLAKRRKIDTKSPSPSLPKSLDTFVVRTTKSEKEAFDEQIARMIYSSNSKFRLVENKEFIRLCQMFKPGYTPPTRQRIADDLLEKVYQSERKQTVEHLENTTVSLSLDGWENVHNDPIVSTSLTTEDGNTILLDTIDTSGNPHDAEYLKTIADASTRKFEDEYKGRVGSIVTDNTGNVKKMRKLISLENKNVLTYGCGSHLLNLLAKDVQIPGVKAHVVSIAKHFRNNHFAAAKYKEKGKPKLTLPSDIRWNSLADCLELYIQNWTTLVAICEENREEIDSEIRTRIMNMSIKRNAEDMLKFLKPIAVALDRLQRGYSSIADSVQAWKILESELIQNNSPKNVMTSFNKRKEQALSPAHYLANIVHPVYQGSKLTIEETDLAMEYASLRSEATPSFMPTLIRYRAQNGKPFLGVLFKPQTLKDVTPIEWWKALKNQIDQGALQIVLQLLTAAASTAGLERIFSTFGIVHSDLRNRLGTEKAAKLVYLMGKFQNTN